MARKKHGGCGTRLYRIWSGMKARCNIQSSSGYALYGARNIKVCKEWKDDFDVFRQWAMTNGYEETLSIDRIDVNGNYEPSNCRWVTMKVQANNTRRNRLLAKGNSVKTVTQWSEETGISISNIENRINYLGWPEEKALVTPTRRIERNKLYAAFGEEKTIRQWAKQSNINYSTLWDRVVRKKMTMEESLRNPPKSRNIPRKP